MCPRLLRQITQVVCYQAHPIILRARGLKNRTRHFIIIQRKTGRIPKGLRRESNAIIHPTSPVY
jgi:hypothetical protein